MQTLGVRNIGSDEFSNYLATASDVQQRATLAVAQSMRWPIGRTVSGKSPKPASGLSRNPRDGHVGQLVAPNWDGQLMLTLGHVGECDAPPYAPKRCWPTNL